MGCVLSRYLRTQGASSRRRIDPRYITRPEVTDLIPAKRVRYMSFVELKLACLSPAQSILNRSPPITADGGISG